MTMISLIQNCVEKAQGREKQNLFSVKTILVFHEPGLFQHKIIEFFC